MGKEQPRKVARVIRKNKYEPGQFFQIPISAFSDLAKLSGNALMLYLILAKNVNNWEAGLSPTMISNLLNISIDAAKKFTANGASSAWTKLVETGFIENIDGEYVFYVDGIPKSEEEKKKRLEESKKKEKEKEDIPKEKPGFNF